MNLIGDDQAVQVWKLPIQLDGLAGTGVACTGKLAPSRGGCAGRPSAGRSCTVTQGKGGLPMLRLSVLGNA
ncbi:hypothetical protein [Deinococcus sp.]|uniref:hypothetical protein n=1 Tax=Deinococcus sp. TaxID=47478 RepID=UPI0025B8B6EC|nr:hypothetical protein [Deinococcus sp.]